MDGLEPPIRADHRQDRRQPRHPGEAVDEIVLLAERDRGADDRRGRESGADRALALALGAAISAFALRIGADRRDVDERRQAGRGGGLGDVARALDMDFVKRPLEDADQVDRGIGPGERGGDGGLVGHVGADELDLAEPAQRLEEPGAPGVAPGDADAHAGLQQRLGDVAAEKAAAAEQSDEQIGLGRHVGPLPPVGCVDKPPFPTARPRR